MVQPKRVDNIDGAMVMANYAYSDALAITLRYSDTEYMNSTITRWSTMEVRFTISPSYVITDDLAGLIEYSSYDAERFLVHG